MADYILKTSKGIEQEIEIHLDRKTITLKQKNTGIFTITEEVTLFEDQIMQFLPILIKIYGSNGHKVLYGNKE